MYTIADLVNLLLQFSRGHAGGCAWAFVSVGDVHLAKPAELSMVDASRGSVAVCYRFSIVSVAPCHTVATV